MFSWIFLVVLVPLLTGATASILRMHALEPRLHADDFQAHRYHLQVYMTADLIATCYLVQRVRAIENMIVVW